MENFGTWRDVEGRLVWGINDFDEAYPMPYTRDLVRLAASAAMAIDEEHMRPGSARGRRSHPGRLRRRAEDRGNPICAGRGHPALREMAAARLRDPEAYWQKLAKLPPLQNGIRASAVRVIKEMFPEPGMPYHIAHRSAGLGSLGRERFVAIALYHGGHIAREAKALAPSAGVWASGDRGTARILYQRLLNRAIRLSRSLRGPEGPLDRAAPGAGLLRASKWDRCRSSATKSNCCAPWDMKRPTCTSALLRRKADSERSEEAPACWLHHAAHQMAAAVMEDWEEWRKAS